MLTVQQAFDLAVQHHRAGRLSEAESLYRQILAVQPNHAEATHYLGLVAHQAGRHELAVEWIQRAILLDPHSAAAHSNLGEACRKLGHLDEAIAAYRRALELKPDHWEACDNLGRAWFGKGEIAEAVAAFCRARDLKPDSPASHFNVGIAWAGWNRFDEAAAAYRRALELQPAFPEAHNNLGAALAAQGRFDEAIAAYRRALHFKPDYPECHNNLGVALAVQRQPDQAAAAFRAAVELRPDYSDAYHNLAIALTEQGQVEQAVAAYRRAFELTPTDAGLLSGIIFTLLYQPGPVGETIAVEQERWNRQFGDPLARCVLPHTNDPDPERRLRIGYVSPNLCDHVVGRNLRPLFECHDRENFGILCYSGVLQPDPLTETIRQRTDRWRSTVNVPDETLAAMIREDGVDILVDLSQHTGSNRLSLFARRPAPVQVSFAGYPESTGLEAIEYRISDRWLEKSGVRSAECGMESDRKREAKFRIPHSAFPIGGVFLLESFWCYDPCGMAVGLNELPAKASGHVTFGCLHNFCKVNDPVLKLWARILGQVKDSRFVLLCGFGSHRQRTLEVLEQEGVAGHRVEFLEPRPRREYLELYHRLDIVLDTFPYNGHNTNLDALWMGVPVVSLCGERAVSRAGLSQLSNLGLPELVAHSEDEYVNIATQLARDRPRLAELRRTLRPRMEASVLMDAPRFARNIEAAYRAMWRQWCMKKAGI